MKFFQRKSGNGTSQSQHLYSMVNFPFIFAWKVGISKNTIKRAKQLTNKYPGLFIPVCWIKMPFAYQHEQFILNLTKRFKVTIWGKGGREIRFIFPGLLIAVWIYFLLALKYIGLPYLFYLFVKHSQP